MIINDEKKNPTLARLFVTVARFDVLVWAGDVLLWDDDVLGVGKEMTF